MALILFTCLGLSACGESKQSTADTASVTGDLEPATARGLAVGVLAHLDSDQVTRVGGTTTDDRELDGPHGAISPAAQVP